jgi:uncharacterized Ntn-hydrolase superfamily protein
MTFSIVARSADGLSHGVAVASKYLSVGAVVPAVEARVGALATQSWANLAHRPQGLTLLRTGVVAADVLAGLIAADPGRVDRQLGVVGASGPGATYTGADCSDWAGGVAGDGYAIQGNMLTGPHVVSEMRDAWLASDPAAALADRLVEALAAGDKAGGDRRGRQSAALLVAKPGGGYGGTSDIAADLRVDDHPEPLGELARLLELHRLYFGRPDPDTLLALTGELAVEVAGRLAALGHDRPELDAALADWAGIQNLEERLVPGQIDPLVLDQLRASAGFA